MSKKIGVEKERTGRVWDFLGISGTAYDKSSKPDKSGTGTHFDQEHLLNRTHYFSVP